VTCRSRTAALRALLATLLAAPLALTCGAAPARPSPPDGAPTELAPSAAPARATFGITAASGGAPDGRSDVAVTAPPGSVVHDTLAVINRSDFPLAVDVYAADVANDAHGGVVLPPRSATPAGAGAWLTLGTGAVSVPAQSGEEGAGYVLVPLTVTIPAAAEPGEYLAGVVASLTAASATADGSVTSIDIEQRTGVRIYLTVSGDLRPGLDIVGLGAHYRQGRALGLAGSGALTVTYTVVNTGNVRVGVRASVRVSGPFHLNVRTAEAPALTELLPGARVEQTVTVEDVAPLVVEDVGVVATAVAAPGRDDPRLEPAALATRGWAVPWSTLGALLLAVAALWWLRRPRRRPRPAAKAVVPSAGANLPTAL